jgi:hypothetical protein
MLHLTLKHIGDGLDASMRMPWETGQIIGGMIGMKIIEKKKWIELRYFLVSEGSLEMHPCSLHGRSAFPNFSDLPNRFHLFSFLIRFNHFASVVCFSPSEHDMDSIKVLDEKRKRA